MWFTDIASGRLPVKYVNELLPHIHNRTQPWLTQYEPARLDIRCEATDFDVTTNTPRCEYKKNVFILGDIRSRIAYYQK